MILNLLVANQNAKVKIKEFPKKLEKFSSYRNIKIKEFPNKIKDLLNIRKKRNFLDKMIFKSK